MQKHEYDVIVDGTPPEVWELFWYRGPRRPTTSGVSIEILHPGDAVGEFARHPQLRRAEVLTATGAVSLPAQPQVFDGAVVEMRPVPAVGEHSESIRREFS